MATRKAELPQAPARRMGFAAHAGCPDVPAFRFAPCGLQAAMHTLPFVPVKAGIQEPRTRTAPSLGPPPSLKLRRAKACGVCRSPKGEDGPRPRGRTEGVASLAFTYSVVKQPCAFRRVNKVSFRQRISAPVLLLGAGIRPTSSLSSFPSNRGGWRATRRMAQVTLGPARSCVSFRASPDRRALGVKRHAPRLAARQRGILAFKPLTVVGPGRVLVPGEAARVRPGDGGCVSHPLAGAAPGPRSQDAS
jgi:hypothetical protein